MKPIRLGKLKIDNPLMVGSGTFGLGDRHPEICQRFGAFVAKTITREPRKGNPSPRIVETSSGIVNSVGIENMGVDRFVKFLGNILPYPTKYIVSLEAYTLKELREIVRKLESVEGIDGYELNLSCPNVKQRTRLPLMDQVWVKKWVKEMRKLTERWFSVKLAPYGCLQVAEICEEEGASALTLCNTYPAMAFYEKERWIQGGLSGPAIKPMGLYNVYHVSQQVKIPIIASGGASNAQDVREYLKVGARAVQLGSILFVRPSIVDEILAELEKEE